MDSFIRIVFLIFFSVMFFLALSGKKLIVDDFSWGAATKNQWVLSSIVVEAALWEMSIHGIIQSPNLQEDA